MVSIKELPKYRSGLRKIVASYDIKEINKFTI